jgi:Rha family phage regulatory protein
MTNLLVSPSISLVNGRPSVTSLQIAEHFGKRHDSVLRDIRRITGDCPSDFHAHNFVEVLQPVERPDGSKIDIPVFLVFRDGFMLLVMGYTGKKALQIKLAYIAAFNAMEAEIAGQKALPTPETTTPSTADDRKPVRSLVNAWAKIANVHQSTLWPQVRAHFQLARIDDLPVEWIPDVLAFVQGKIDELGKMQREALPEHSKGNLYGDLSKVAVEAQTLIDTFWRHTQSHELQVERLTTAAGRLFQGPNRRSNVSTRLDMLVKEHRDAMRYLEEASHCISTVYSKHLRCLMRLAWLAEDPDSMVMADIRRL